MINLKGKTALLTASGQGIGFAVAKAFAASGAYVIATDVNSKTLSTLDGIVSETHLLNVTDNNVNIASVSSSVKGVPNRFIYGASKAAVLGMTKSIASDYITQGIRCNAICPGTIESPSLEQRLSDMGDYQKARKEFVARQPMGRIGEAEEIASLALYLASDASAYTTGQFHVIDGGMCI